LSFNGAQFWGDVTFDTTRFLKNSDFKCIKFYKDAYYSNAVFEGNSTFDDSEFLDRANFQKKRFSSGLLNLSA